MKRLRPTGKHPAANTLTCKPDHTQLTHGMRTANRSSRFSDRRRNIADV
jgi:hypothetical protein